MTNTCEPMINPVKANRLKVPMGLDQNGTQSDVPFHAWGHTDTRTAGGELGSNPSCRNSGTR